MAPHEVPPAVVAALARADIGVWLVAAPLTASLLGLLGLDLLISRAGPRAPAAPRGDEFESPWSSPLRPHAAPTKRAPSVAEGAL